MVDKEADNLTRIKGIGPSRQKWFREILGVAGFEQLAKLSPDVVESALKGEGRIVSRSIIEEWITEAARIVSEEPEGGQGASFLRNDGWCPVASFVVEFQERCIDDQTEQRTLVHHMESAEEQTLIHEIEEEATVAKTWPGLESRRLCEWMMKRLAAKTEEGSAAGKGNVLPAPGKSPVAYVEMRRMQIYQPQGNDVPLVIDGGNGELSPVSYFVKGREPLSLEVVFNSNVQEVRYEAVFYLENIATGDRSLLGEPCHGIAKRGENFCTTDLDQPSIVPGFFRITVVVTMQCRKGGAGYLQSPPLQVI